MGPCPKTRGTEALYSILQACAACSRPNDTARSTDRPAGSAEAVKKHHNKLRERKGLLKDSKSGDELNNRCVQCTLESLTLPLTDTPCPPLTLPASH